MAKKSIEDILGQHFGVSSPTSAKRVEVETEFGEIIPVVDTPVLLTERRRIAQGIDGVKQALTDNEEQKRKAFISSRPTGYDGVVQGAYGSHSFGNPQLRQQDGANYTSLKADQQTTNVILGRAQKALDTYTEQDQKRDIKLGQEKSWFSEFLGGLGDTNQEDVGNILFMDLPSISHTGKINNILEKESKGEKITDTEQLALNAYKISLDANQVLADEGGATTSTAIGQSLPANIGYAAQTFGTGGMLGITRNVATNGVRALGVALAAEAARTPMRGAMYKNFQNRTSDQYSIKDDGAVVKDKETSPYERIGKSYASTFTEGATEHAGNLFGVGLSSKLLKSVAPRLLKTKFGSAILKSTGDVARSTKAFREGLQRATGYNNIPAELLEEEASNIIEPLLTGEPERLGDNFTVKNQLITLGSVVAFGGVTQMSSFPSIATAQIEKHSMRRSINKSLSSIEIPELRQQVYDATKKNMSIEGRAQAISALDWKNLSAWDRAHAIDAFQGSIVLDQYNGFELSRKTEEMTAQKIQTWNVIYQQSANRDTGAIEELADEQDNRYLLLAGSLEDESTDETLFVRNAQTGMTEQIGRSSVRRVGEAESYDSGLRKIIEQSSTQASEQILADQSSEEDQDAQEIGVQPIAYNFGDNVTLADGRQGQFLGYHNDGSNIAQVAFVDQQTGEQESAEVPKSHIVGFAYPNDASQREPAQELPNVEQSEQSGNAQQELPSESVQREIPTTKDGAPDYDAMPADMYLEEYSKIASRDEALDDLRGEKIALDKQIKKLQSSNNATSRNTKIANRAKVSGLQTKVDDITRVLQENTPQEAMAAQAEQSVPKPTSLKHSMLDLGDYVSVEDYILRDIASGLKFRWSDDGAKRGLAKELGFENSNQERKSRIGILQNDGTTIDRYAESISGLLGNAIPAFSVDEQDIRSAVIDVLGSVSSPAQAAAKVRALHADSFDEQANDYYLGELEKYKLEVAEYDAALDLWVNELSEADFAEIDALFESELLTLRDQITDNDGYNQTNPRRTAVAQDATAETGEDQSRQGGDNGRAGDQNIDPRGKTKESTTRQDDQRVDDPISSAQTQVQKYEAVKDYVEQLNQLSGADAVVFSKLEQLPDAVAIEFEAQWRAEPNQETPGVTIGTKVYLYAPHIKDAADLEVVFNHEVAAHRNVLLALGQDRKAEVELYSAVVDGIGVPKMLQLIEDPVFSELADLYFGTSTQSSKIELGKEFVGYFTETHFDKKEYSNVGAGKLSLNLSEKITIEDVINILNTANRKGNEQRITIENSRNGSGQVAYEKDDTRNMGQDRAGQTSDLAGRGSNIVLAPENTASDLSGIQKNPTHSKNTNGGSTESDSNSGTEIRQEDVRRAGGIEQTDSSTDAFEQTVKGDKKNIGAKSISDKKILSEDEYLKSRLNELYHNAESSNNTITREIWEDSEEYISIYNDVVDSYENYIIELSDSGLLQKIYDEASFSDEIKIRNSIKATSLSINDLLNTEPKRLLRKEQKDRQNAINRRERLSKISNDIRFRQIESDNTAETEQIRQQAVERGDFLKAPNGEQTNLTEPQWLQVRTAAFKEWFGDWERAARIEKLHKAKSVEITGNEISNTSDRNILKPLAERYGLDHCRGEFLNRDTGSLIVVVRDGIRETVRHGYDISHLQSVAAIPDMISSSVYITSLPNTQPSKKSNSIVSFDYYVVGLSINGVNYTAKLAIGVDDKGHKFYDHALTQIEKSDLISQLGISVPINESQTAQSVESKLDYSNLSEIKDKRLISILQTNSSKVVDANGEPMVVYHGSGSEFTSFDIEKIGQHGTNEGKGIYFAQKKSIAEAYKENDTSVYEVFIRIVKPLDAQKKTITKVQLRSFIKQLDANEIDILLNFGDVDYDGYDKVLMQAVDAVYDYSDNDVEIVGDLITQTGDYVGVHQVLSASLGYDGVVETNPEWGGDGNTIYVVAQPNQIKSATSNTGVFRKDSNDIRYREVESNNPVEIEQIRQQSIERGDFLKAPNGEQTNLTERQWLQVRTAAFKEWFGDWERAARIEKLHKAKSVEITGNEIAPSEDLKQYKRNALEYGKALRGEYVNKDTGEKIVLHRSAVKEVLNHDYKDFEHLQSIAAIPQIIEQSIYITTASNEDVFTNPDVASYDYYVCGLNVGDLDYTVRAVVATKSDGKRYYDHKLSAIEKGKLIEKLTPYAAFAPSGLSSTVGSEESTPFRPADKSGETSKISPVSDFKDKRLISILQTNSSKVVDANGEPMVVCHGSDSDFYEFSHDKISNQEGSFFFAQNIEDAEGYSSGALIEAFVNLRNPANFEDLPLEVLRLNDKKAIVERLKPEGYDGWVEGLKDGWGEISAFNPNQIKSATENTGDFSSQNNDIRYSDQSLLSEVQSQHEYEQNKAKTYVNAEKRKAQVVEQLQKLTEKFGVDTVIVNNTKELPQSVRYRTRNARFTGLYDKRDGKVYFVASEIRDADDATATFLHEVVSHKGIDALMGHQRADKFYIAVFDSLPQEERARLLAKYGDKVLAGDELVARMAEGNVTPSVMQRVIAAVRKFFRETLGFSLTISDNDIRYVLWKSKNNLERASTLGEVFSVIERDRALCSELYPPNKSLMDQVRQVATESRTRVISQEVDQKENADFNADLSRYASSLMKANEYLHVGLPSGALSQILPRLPIVVKQGVITKAIAKKHNLTIDSLENLPAYLSNPIFIFSRDDRSVGVLTDIADKEGKNTCVAIRINTLMQNGKEFVEVNDIATIHGRDAENIISPIVHNNSLIWADKRKGLNWLSSAQLNGQEIDNQNLISATKIIENYQNSTLNDLRYRTVKPFVATDKKGNEYLRVSGKKGGWGSNAIQTSEKFVDQYVKVKYLVDEVRRRGGDVNILNNVYDELNLKDSKASAATDHYADDFFEPLMNHFKHLGKYKFQYKQISDYINAKSSIERDESGTSALDKDPKGKWTKSTAQKIVDKFEAVVEKQDVAKLWDLWRSATSQPLQVATNSGRISFSELKQIQSKDWQYYAPLRGKDFDFEGVQDMREVFYLNSNQRHSNADISKAEVTKRALGRTSKAADPVAALIHMTNQEIYLSQENKALRYLLRLVEANIEMKDLFELKKVYYEKIGDDWIELEGTPDRAKMEATNNARLAIMRYHKELRATSDINLMHELIDKISAEQDKITITSREAEAKQKGYTGASKYAGDVAIMKDGVKYIVQIKDPEVAGAINYKPDGLQRGLSNTIGRGTRFMGMMKTSKNPAFIGSNKARDFVGGAFYNYVHRDGDLKGFLKHSETHYGAISRRIKGKASLLDVAQLGGRNILDRTDRSVLAKIYGEKQVEDTIYDLFVLSGGLTGYFHNPDVKEHQKKSERNIKRKSKRYYLGKGLNSLNKGIDYLSEVAENSTRFAAFMAQIDNGANVPAAIKHAKNVSVNFNRKGRYSKGIGAVILFFNATMQGVKRLYDLFMGEADYTNRERWAQRGRFALATVVGASIGYWSTVMVKSMLRGLIGDDDQEYMVSLYERCTNLLIPVSGAKGGYVKIPIDISLRPAYGLGVLLSDWQDGLISKQDVVDNFLQMMAANVYPIEVNVFNPLGLKNQVLEAITPSIIEPLADIGNNRDFTGNTIFREAPYSPHTPQSQLGKRNANVYLVNFTKWLNEFFGGNEFTPAGVNIDGTFNWRNMFDLNPSKLEHIFSQYFAGVGKTANDLIVTLSSIKNGTDIEARKIPIANRFYGEAYEKDPSREYYDIKKNIERVNRNNKKAKELGVRSAIFTEDESPTKYAEYENYGKAIKELERKTQPIKEKLGQMQVGSQEYDLLKSQMDRLHRQFIKQYNDQRN